MGRGPQITNQYMERRFMINLPDNAVGIMSNGIGQTIAVTKLLLTSISQEPHRSWNALANRTHLPGTWRTFSSGCCILTCLLIDKSYCSITLGETQVFNLFNHSFAQDMRLTSISTQTRSKSS